MAEAIETPVVSQFGLERPEIMGIYWQTETLPTMMAGRVFRTSSPELPAKLTHQTSPRRI